MRNEEFPPALVATTKTQSHQGFTKKTGDPSQAHIILFERGRKTGHPTERRRVPCFALLEQVVETGNAKRPTMRIVATDTQGRQRPNRVRAFSGEASGSTRTSEVLTRDDRNLRTRHAMRDMGGRLEFRNPNSGFRIPIS